MDGYPLNLFLEKGIMCTISTDDPFSFGNSLEDEYLACVEKLNLPPAKLVEIAKNGFCIANLPVDQKDYFLRQIDQVWRDFRVMTKG